LTTQEGRARHRANSVRLSNDEWSRARAGHGLAFVAPATVREVADAERGARAVAIEAGLHAIKLQCCMRRSMHRCFVAAGQAGDMGAGAPRGPGGWRWLTTSRGAIMMLVAAAAFCLALYVATAQRRHGGGPNSCSPGRLTV